jgi:hypothetical protein
MRGKSRHGWPIRALGILLWLAPMAATADEFHDGEEGGVNEVAAEEEASTSFGSPGGTTSAFVEERKVSAGAKLRDASGKLTAPPNFRVASVVFEDSIKAKPTPAPVKTVAPAEPKIAIEQIPTYSGSAPSAVTGYIGVELTAEEAKKAPAKPSFQNGRRATADTAGKIRNAIEGSVQSESEQQAKEALREKMRAPAAVGP